MSAPDSRERAGRGWKGWLKIAVAVGLLAFVFSRLPFRDVLRWTEAGLPVGSHFIAGHGGYPLIGTPEQIVAQVERLSALGVDGMLLSWLDYLGECRHWIDEVLPLMERAGLRTPGRGEAI